MNDTVDLLSARIGYHFQHAARLRQALTHRSHSVDNYERLEFLGDAVLELALSAYLFQNYPAVLEGQLTQWRASLVNREALSNIARRIGLADFMRLSEGENQNGGGDKNSILADTFEAVIAVIYLETEWQDCCKVIYALFGDALHQLAPSSGENYKNLLQEWLQARQWNLPCYTLIAQSGKAHAPTFRVRCGIPQLQIMVEAQASSRREAEKQAARRAYQQCLENSANVDKLH